MQSGAVIWASQPPERRAVNVCGCSAVPTCPGMPAAALPTAARLGNRPQPNGQCSLHPVDYRSAIKRKEQLIHATTGRHLGTVWLNERSQAPKKK